jgi:S1-C subfamily serine protease
MRGVVVTNIESDSPSEATLMPGDIIIEIDRKAVTNTDDYKNIASQIKTDKVLTVLVYRKGSTLFVTIGGE